jgi:hypothetical protein
MRKQLVEGRLFSAQTLTEPGSGPGATDRTLDEVMASSQAVGVGAARQQDGADGVLGSEWCLHPLFGDRTGL